MNISFKIVSFFLFISCSFIDPGFIRKKLNNNDITVIWYYYSNTTSGSPDYVKVIRNNESRLIYEATDVVTDVYINRKSIVIKLFEPHRGIIYSDSVPTDVFGYKIILDSSATYQEYLSTPQGVN